MEILHSVKRLDCKNKEKKGVRKLLGFFMCDNGEESGIISTEDLVVNWRSKSRIILSNWSRRGKLCKLRIYEEIIELIGDFVGGNRDFVREEWKKHRESKNGESGGEDGDDHPSSWERQRIRFGD